MTARLSLIRGRTRGHRPRLQPMNFQLRTLARVGDVPSIEDFIPVDPEDVFQRTPVERICLWMIEPVAIELTVGIRYVVNRTFQIFITQGSSDSDSIGPACLRP